MSQRSFASAEYALKKKRTRREKFLAEMERIVPWARLIAVIEPLYPTSGRVGRQPVGVPRMLRMYCLQQWYGLADEALEDALYDSQALRDFVGIDLSRESVPDATTLLKFRRLLQDNDLTRGLFDQINAHLGEQGLLMRAGTIVDATIIAAPSSTKNEDKARDPEMHQTRKGRQWYFGMKMHIGVDSRTGLAHSAVVTAANVHDKHPLPDLLHGAERRVYGDSAYASQKGLIEGKAPNARDFTNQRVRKDDEAREVKRSKNRNKSRVRARVEHVFAVVKRLWGFGKVRYRGLAKNATRSFVVLGLANLYLARGPLYEQIRA